MSATQLSPIKAHKHRLRRQRREETARLLIRARGYHGAIDACLRNGWEEILDLLVTCRRPQASLGQ